MLNDSAPDLILFHFTSFAHYQNHILHMIKACFVYITWYKCPIPSRNTHEEKDPKERSLGSLWISLINFNFRFLWLVVVGFIILKKKASENKAFNVLQKSIVVPPIFPPFLWKLPRNS